MERKLIDLVSSSYINIAKLSKYVHLQGEKIRRIVRVKQRGITKEETKLHALINNLNKCKLGKEPDVISVRKIVMNRVVGVNKVCPGLISPITLNLRVTEEITLPNKEEILHLLRRLDIELKELLENLLEEKRIVEELHMVLRICKKRNLNYIADYINDLDKKLELQIEDQNARMSENLVKYVQKNRIIEEPYANLGRIYTPENPNGKGIIIFAGTTLNFTQYEPLSYRFALENFTVLALNLPSHGNDINFRLGNGAKLLAWTVQFMKRKCAKVGVIGFSFGALSSLYTLFSFDYGFEVQLRKRLHNFVRDLKIDNFQRLESSYSVLKNEIHTSILNVYNTSVAGYKSRGVLDAIIFAGMPISLYRSKKLVCPSIIAASYGRMKWVTNTFFNQPPELLRKVVNGFDRHQPVAEYKYLNEKSIYLKQFEIKSEKEFENLKQYLHDLTKDPENVLELLGALQEGQYINYLLNKIREIPKIFMYGKKDAIAGGSLLDFFHLKNIQRKRVEKFVEFISTKSAGPANSIQIYPGIGHTLDERAGFLKKLSRRPQNIAIQNDMVNFMKTYL